MIGQKTLLQDSTRESSTLMKLAGSTHGHCEFLQLWQAARTVLMEVQGVFERFSQCLALTVDMYERSNHARSSTDTEARASQSREAQIFSLMGIKADVRKVVSLGARQHAPRDHFKVQMLVSIPWAVVLCYQGSELGGDSLSYQSHLVVSSLAYHSLSWAYI